MRALGPRLRVVIPLLKELVYREVRGRYAGSGLGFFWSVIHPLLQLAIFTLVFGVAFKQRMENDPSLAGFSLYLFCGLLSFNALAESLTRGGSSLLENASLIKNLRFPAKALQLALVLNAQLHQTLGILVLFAALIFLRGGLPATVLLLPPLLLLEVAFYFGLAMLAAALTVAYRDLLQLLPVVTMVWFYATPLIYFESMVPPRLHWLLMVNPARHFVTITRALVLEGTPGMPRDWALAAAQSILMLAAGFVWFTRHHAEFADEL